MYLGPSRFVFSLSLVSLAAAQGGNLVERSSPLQVVEPDPSERELRLTPVVRAVQRAADSVVSIYLQHQLARGAVTEGQGSGVILDESGLVITNWHVIAPVLLQDGRQGEVGVAVKLRDGRSRTAQVLTTSPQRDLALLQLQLQGQEKVKPIEIGRSGDLMIGETVIAIGNPQGHANTVTSGVLSAIDRSIKVQAPDRQIREYSGLLQTDAAINQGNSGGALLDITGRLIGINNAMAMGAENIGFAIPMDRVREEFQRQLLQSANFVGAADGPWLGLEVHDHDGGVVVAEVVPGGPAAIAGVEAGDVVVKVAGDDVRSSIDYLRRIVSLRTRQPVALGVTRNGRRHELEPVPIPRYHGLLLHMLGADIEEIDLESDRELVKHTTLAFYRGSGLRRVAAFPAVLRVQRVVADSPAEAFGLQAGDVLLSIVEPGPFGAREVPLTSLRAFSGQVERARGGAMRLAFLRGDKDYQGTIDVRSGSRR